jgi:hypothetical protein
MGSRLLNLVHIMLTWEKNSAKERNIPENSWCNFVGLQSLQNILCGATGTNQTLVTLKLEDQ